MTRHIVQGGVYTWATVFLGALSSWDTVLIESFVGHRGSLVNVQVVTYGGSREKRMYLIFSLVSVFCLLLGKRLCCLAPTRAGVESMEICLDG